ncbi:MAG: macro domain-containing protein, partial [Psychromonas sp.]
IHTVGPIYKQSSNPSVALEAAYLNSLRLALANHCQSVAFPAISCGIYGYPHQEAAEVSLNICYEKEFAALDIYFYLLGQSMVDIWKAANNELRSR